MFKTIITFEENTIENIGKYKTIYKDLTKNENFLNAFDPIS